VHSRSIQEVGQPLPDRAKTRFSTLIIIAWQQAGFERRQNRTPKKAMSDCLVPGHTGRYGTSHDLPVQIAEDECVLRVKPKNRHYCPGMTGISFPLSSTAC
jgi:hypothetical protein